MSPNVQIAALLFSFLFSFVLILYVSLTTCLPRFHVLMAWIFQQRCSPALPPIGLVEVDVSCLTLFIPHRGSPRIW